VPSVGELYVVKLPMFLDERGLLVAVEFTQVVPFKVSRLFWISGVPQGASRGAHAHAACHQYVICGAGSVFVDVDDGIMQRSITLETGTALHVPPRIFLTLRLHDPGSLALVLCDRTYEQEDYLDREKFLKLIASGK
jgi:hypothetical protein